jgi:hypothetical protein
MGAHPLLPMGSRSPVRRDSPIKVNLDRFLPRGQEGEGLTRSPALIPAFSRRGGKARLRVNPEQPWHLYRGVEGLTLGRLVY